MTVVWCTLAAENGAACCWPAQVIASTCAKEAAKKTAEETRKESWIRSHNAFTFKAGEFLGFPWGCVNTEIFEYESNMYYLVF